MRLFVSASLAQLKTALIALVIVLLGASAAFSQGDAGRESPFSLGAGARGMGMGRAFASLPGDASSVFSNPAATASIDRTEFTAFHTSLFLGTNYDCLALSHPIGMLGVFTLSVGRLGTGDIIQRDQFNRPEDTFSASDFLLGFSYARSIGYGLAAGLTVKDVGLEVGDDAGYGFGMDLGFHYAPYFAPGLYVGIGLADLIQPRIKLRSAEDVYQTVSRFGLSYSREFNENFGAAVVTEIEKIGGRDSRFHPGLEVGLYQSLFLRTGYAHDRMTFGGGVAYNIIKIDYAYENIEHLGGSHRVSFGVSFGKSVRKSRDEMVFKAVETEKATWQESLDRQRSIDYATYLSRGDSLCAAGKHQDALINYQRALVIDETSEKARVMADSMMDIIITVAASGARDQRREDLTLKRIEAALGDMKAGRFNQAISQYELALEIDPANTKVAELLQSARITRTSEIDNMRRRARAYRQSNDHSNAITEWNRLLGLEPQDSEALSGIETSKSELRVSDLVASAVRAIDEGKFSNAVTFLNEAQTLKPNDKAIQSLLSEARAKSAPITSLTDIKSNQEHWDIYLRGLERYQAGEFKQALDSWESLRPHYPNNSDLENNIGQARQRLATEGGQKQ
jgi:tetratricopeptide (TPR) repeat protein